MKNYLIPLIILLIALQATSASWLNPFSWFKKQAPQPTQQTQSTAKELQKATSAVEVASDFIKVAQAQKVKTVADFYSVVKVVDGDTVSVDINGTITTLRLIGINTPETVDPRKPVECFGKEASNKAKEILSGEKVRVVTDASQGALDKYGRTLAYVFLEDGTNFNEYMIKEGYAYEYTYNTPYQYQKEFKLAQGEAQKLKRGLWADGACEMKNVSTETIPTKIINEETKIVANNTNYICSQNTYNCTDFKTHAEAQAVYEACGGVSNDIHRLDNDKDGESCESLP